MLDLRDSENSNWIKNVGQQDEGEGIEKSSPLLTLQEWLDKQAHDDLRPTNPPSRPPHKGAVWNRETHRWSKSGTSDLGKQQTMKRGWHDHSKTGEERMPPHPAGVEDHEKYFKEQKEQGGDEQSFVESDSDKEKRAEEMSQPKGQIAQKLKKFNDKVEKFLKTLDDLIGGHVENPQQTYDDLVELKDEVDQEIENGRGKIKENEGKLDDLHNSGKIDDETEEKARQELEEMRKYYEEQERILGKWDEEYEALKEKLSLEELESAGDFGEEFDDEDAEDDVEDKEEETDEEELEDEETEEEESDDEEETEEEPDEPTVEDNAKTLLDRTTQETDELKETRKEIERQQKLLERKLEEVGDDDESRKEITDQLTHAKNRVDTMNTSIQTQTRKLDMANALLNKKPSLNGATQE